MRGWVRLHEPRSVGFIPPLDTRPGEPLVYLARVVPRDRLRAPSRARCASSRSTSTFGRHERGCVVARCHTAALSGWSGCAASGEGPAAAMSAEQQLTAPRAWWTRWWTRCCPRCPLAIGSSRCRSSRATWRATTARCAQRSCTPSPHERIREPSAPRQTRPGRAFRGTGACWNVVFLPCFHSALRLCVHAHHSLSTVCTCKRATA